MGVYVDYIQARSLGTGTAKTQLSGDLSGNAASWKTPTACKGVLWVQPIQTQITPTSTQSFLATMTVESTDLGFPPFEVIAVPLGNAVATTDLAISQDQALARYPLMFDATDSVQNRGGSSIPGGPGAPAQMGGANINFYGIPQVANTAAPFMGAQVWWTDTQGLAISLRGPGGPFSAVVGGAFGGGAASTSTGTATGAVTGKTATIAGSATRTMRGLFGAIAATTSVTVVATAGALTFSAPELPFVQRLAIEPLQGPLGVSQVESRYMRNVDISFPFITPTTINFNAYFDNISSTAGNWIQGILYQ